MVSARSRLTPSTCSSRRSRRLGSCGQRGVPRHGLQGLPDRGGAREFDTSYREARGAYEVLKSKLDSAGAGEEDRVRLAARDMRDWVELQRLSMDAHGVFKRYAEEVRQPGA